MLNASRKIANTQGLRPKLLDKFYPSASDLSDTLISMKEIGIDPRFWKATNKSGHYNHAAHEAVAEMLRGEMLGVVVAGVIMALTGIAWIDSLVSFVIIALILYLLYHLLIDSVTLALDVAPENINKKAVHE